MAFMAGCYFRLPVEGWTLGSGADAVNTAATRAEMQHISGKTGMDMTVIYGHSWTSRDIRRDN
jgi:hypothetical protein